MLARAVLPSLRCREDVRAGVLERVTQVQNAGREEVRAYRRNWRVNAGAHVLTPGRTYIDDPRPAARGDRWHCKPENARFLRQFLRLSASRELDVFWVLPTNAPGLSAARANDGRDVAYYQFLRSLQAEFPRLTIIDPRPILSDSALFADACHLNRHGAIALTAALAPALERALSGQNRDRWIVLNARVCDDQVVHHRAKLEDLGRSLEIIRLMNEAGTLSSGRPRSTGQVTRWR
jgi:hypothetical protein